MWKYKRVNPTAKALERGRTAARVRSLRSAGAVQARLEEARKEAWNAYWDLQELHLDEAAARYKKFVDRIATIEKAVLKTQMLRSCEQPLSAPHDCVNGRVIKVRSSK